MTTEVLRIPSAASAAAFSRVRDRSAALGLGAIVAISFVARAVASLGHLGPQYFPDEYIYSSLSRSIAEHGTLQIRGETVHFPALLEPLLAAPFWLSHDQLLAYRLTQLEHALAMSLAAVPVYLLVRRLGGGTRWSLLGAAIAVAPPSLVFSSYVTADSIGYPLALAAIAAIVAAIDTPTRRLQIAVVVLSGLATFARVQYVVLPVVFLVAAAVVERGNPVRVARRFPIVAAAFALPLVALLAAGPTHVLGYYDSVIGLHVSLLRMAHWYGVDGMLLALTAGVVLVPAAIAGIGAALVRPATRAERAFAASAVTFAGLLLLEAALYASNGASRFQERYLITLAPLAAPALLLAVRRGTALRVPVALMSLGLLAYVARVPLSGYTYGSGAQDSPFITTVQWLEQLTHSYGIGSLVVATVGGLLAVFAALVVLRPGLAEAALWLTLATLALTSVGTTLSDRGSSSATIANYLPQGRTFIDDLHLGPVTYLAPYGTERGVPAEYLFWNRSLDRVALLPGAPPPDDFPAFKAAIADDGTIDVAGKPVHTALVIGQTDAIANLTHATLVRRTRLSSIWRPQGIPHMSMLTVGRYTDGWFAAQSSVSIWPDASGWTNGTLHLRFHIAKRARPSGLHIAGSGVDRTIHFSPGSTVSVALPVHRRGPWSVVLRTTVLGVLPDTRAVAAKGDLPVFDRTAPLKNGTPSADRSRR